MELGKIRAIPKEEFEKEYKLVGNIFDVIAAIESVVSDDFSCDIEDDLARGRLTTEKEKEMAEKIGKVYKIAHAWNPAHSCYSVHENWREESKKLT